MENGYADSMKEVEVGRPDGSTDEEPLRPPSLLGLPSYLVSHVARIGHDALIPGIVERDLRLPHFAALTALADFGPLPQHELADRLGLNRSHLVGYLDTIEKRGFVRRDRDPADRRRQVVALTSEGQRAQRELQGAAESAQEQFLDSLSPAERVTLVDLLRRILVADDRSRAQPEV